jgi:hypothetical protein
MNAIAILLASTLAAGGPPDSPATDGGYAVVISAAARADPAWRAVADALLEKYGEKHGAFTVVWSRSVMESRAALARLRPRFACFVARPEECPRPFVVDVHRLARKLDDDPYGDVLWGILTGYTAEDALRIARLREPLVIRKGAAGTGIDLGLFDEGVWYSEGEAGVRWEKAAGGKPERKTGPQDSTKAIVDMFSEFRPDLFLTSGHATERDWQIGYSYRNGQFRCKGGVLYGIDLERHAFPIRSPNPKVYLPLGNCLMGHVKDRESMALAFMSSGGACQMAGYVVSTWFGYGGWGIRDYFMGQPGRFTLAESFFANSQALVHRLETRFPASARAEFDEWEIERDNGLIGKIAAAIGHKEWNSRVQDNVGLLWDRDTVAFYGDPAWEARLAPRPLAWEEMLREDGGTWTFEITAAADVSPGRPPFALLPWRLEAIEVIEGRDLEPLIAENFILLGGAKKLEKGKTCRVVFRARPAAAAAVRPGTVLGSL